jgi:hypothetical protein
LPKTFGFFLLSFDGLVACLDQLLLVFLQIIGGGDGILCSAVGKLFSLGRAILLIC